MAMDVGKLEKFYHEGEEGRWVGDLHRLPGVRLRVRSYGSGIVARALGAAYRRVPAESRHDDGTVKEEVAQNIDRDILAGSVLTGWEGLESDGEPFPFTQENARRLLEYADFEAAVKIAAGQVGNEEDERVKAMAGNSPAPSKRKGPAKA